MKKGRSVSRFMAVLSGIGVLALFASGCATPLTFQRQSPPNLDTLGIQKLAVMPFKTTDSSSLQRQAAAWLTSESLSRIQATNHFTLIGSSQIEQAQLNRRNIEDLADALFNGQVVSLSVRDSSENGSYKDKEGNTIYYTTYTRVVEMAFNYSITRTRDGTLIGPVNKSDRTSSSSRDSPYQLSTPESMIQSLIRRNLSGLAQDVAPHTVTERRQFLTEVSKDKLTKQSAKDALVLVKTGNLKTAQNAFMNIYQTTGSFSAGYNAGLIIEALGDLEGAHALMQQLYNETGNQKAYVEISRIEKAMSDRGLLGAYSENQNQRDKVIALMVETIPAQIKSGSKIAVINNSRNERDLAESVTNGIIHGLQTKNITIVDRSNNSLAEAERNYQLSGNVSDDDIVSIGHEAGVSVFALVSVTGSGGSRRLSLRLLDVETSMVIYQSPQSDEMNL